MYAKYIKRILDFALSFFAIVVLSPLFLILIIVGAIFMRGNPFFTQQRPGKDERIFRLIKFRTMDNRKDENGELLPDEVRLNTYGRFLRKTSLDELPELFNILKGDMAIVGPRPLATIYLPYYTKQEMRRHNVSPGLTGWAQIHGRNSVTWEKRFEYDLYYVDNCSFKLDLKTIFQTIVVVFKHEGIGQGEERPESFCDVRQRQWDEDLVSKDR